MRLAIPAPPRDERPDAGSTPAWMSNRSVTGGDVELAGRGIMPGTDRDFGVGMSELP